MRNFASAAVALLLFAFTSPAFAQGSKDSGPAAEDENAEPYPDEGPYDEAPAPDERGPGYDERGKKSPSYDDEQRSDAPNGDGERYGDDKRYDDDAVEPPHRKPSKRYADVGAKICSSCTRKHPYWRARRPDTGFRPYADAGLSGFGYGDGYYGTYPEAY